MSTNQCNNSSPDTSTKFSILDLKAQAVRLPVSKGSQILLSELLTWSGEKGYCWWSVPKIAKDLGWSASSVWRRSAELQDAQLLEVIPRAGRSNYWVPLPGKTKMERLRFELTPLATPRGPFLKENEKLKRCTVPNLGTSTNQAPPSLEPKNVNAINICSEKMAPLQGTTPDTPLDSIQEPIPVVQTPPHEPIRHKSTPVQVPKPKAQASITPEQIFLVDEIERVTGDTWSRGHFLNLVRQADEQTVYAALSVTKEKMTLESGVNGGAYFTSTVRGMIELASLGAGPVADVSTQQSCPSYPTSDPPARPARRLFHADEPEPEPCDPEALKKGWRLHYKAAGVQGMLSLVQRCVPVSVDVTSLWMDVRETFPGMQESILIDRLLDTVVTRARHAERMRIELGTEETDRCIEAQPPDLFYDGPHNSAVGEIGG
jgi:hypothetical protein